MRNSTLVDQSVSSKARRAAAIGRLGVGDARVGRVAEHLTGGRVEAGKGARGVSTS